MRTVTVAAGLVSIALWHLAACASVPTGDAPEPAAERVTNVAVHLGARQLDEDDWEPVDQPAALGIELDSYRPDQLVGFELGVQGSEDDDDFRDSVLGNVDVEAKFWEVYAGVRKTWAPGGSRVRPYVGGGVTYLDADVEVDVPGLGSASDDDSSLGLYLHGGVDWQVVGGLLLGFDLRAVVGTDISLAGVDSNADYVQAAFVIGYSI